MKMCAEWVLTGLLMAGPALSAEDALQAVLREQAGLEQALQHLQALEQQASQACWQRFAVNDCLRQVRRDARREREPLHAQWLEMRERERALRLHLREQRLQEKADPHD